MLIYVVNPFNTVIYIAFYHNCIINEKCLMCAKKYLRPCIHTILFNNNIIFSSIFGNRNNYVQIRSYIYFGVLPKLSIHE